MTDPPLQGTQKGDVFSFAMVVQEIITRDRPYYLETMTPEGAGIVASLK